MKYNFISIGGATRDIVFLTSDGIMIDNHRDLLRQKLLAFEYGAKIKVNSFHHLFGGGAANAAVNFANSGFKVACLANIGGDESGRAVLANLKGRGVATSLMSISPSAFTGLSFILVSDEGERIIFSNRLANENLAISLKEKALLEQTEYIYLASLSGNWQKTAKQIFSAKKPKIVWNPGASQYKLGLKKLSPFLKRTEILCVNKDEALELVLSSASYRRKGLDFFKDVKNILPILKAAGPNIVLITSGQEGADVYDGRNFYHQDIIKEKKRVDVTGVGDVFNSSFLIGMILSRGDIKKSLYLGARNAASKIAHFGAQSGLLDLRKIK
jgi:sugar/nucleoside kinase (ribokinase family)